ncbi:MAG: hypothetical protein U1E38_04115 [Rhodospirillales bacterium]
MPSCRPAAVRCASTAGCEPSGRQRPGVRLATVGRACRPLPWLLAGGLHAGNLAEAVQQSGAAAVDVSSGVEDAPAAIRTPR